MSNSGRMPNGVNGNRVLAVGRRTNTALGRRPLAVSMRTNKAVNENAVRTDANNAFKEVLKREAASNKPLRFKASKTVAVNDENAENATVPAAEKSKIPIGDKKLALKKTKHFNYLHFEVKYKYN
ncbi:unnamed protein product [Medioppia subpectinata]|uniref:Uncharacterized protein n=1 Tax=Medioppia subpectinata TaxID=1979941 RepID=A0A7R9KLN3_9ACAR|nr:unnamed protein product [Medioppia subpectinata]CAG2105898.1 unnamed protein product [Medioppia subpectinata]